MSAALRFLLVIAAGLAPIHAGAQSPRIDPAGVPGALLICSSEVSEAAFNRFIDLAGGAHARIAVVYANDKKAAGPVLAGLAKSAKDRDAAPPRLLAWPAAKSALPELTGVWLIAGRDPGSWKIDAADGFVSLLKRPGVVAASGPGADILGDAGLRLLPGFSFGGPGADAKKEAVAIEIKDGATLQVRGRTLSAVGPGAVVVSLWAGGAAVGTHRLEGKARLDLIALRRAVRDRAEGFPPKAPAPPVVENGTLVIVGGGGRPVGLFEKFVACAGGKGKANIVIFPTAQDPIVKREDVALEFKNAGAAKATVLYGKTQSEVESPEFLDTLKEATGLWFDGGRQWRFVDCYENTRALPLMFDVLKRGGAIGGSSAGATIQGEYLCRGGVFDNFDIRFEGYERGLGFLKGVAIDQHFSQRKRQADMTALMKIHPQYLGIGIDEATAIIVTGQVAEVIGKGKAHFYDAQRKIEKGQPDYEALPAGGRYDLKERKVLRQAPP